MENSTNLYSFKNKYIFNIPVFFPFLIFLFSTVISCKQKIDFNNPEDVEKFNSKVERILQETGVHGVSLAVIDSAEVIFSNYYGYRDMENREKVDGNTLFEACSLSKMYFVFAAMKLVEEGVLDLDLPLYTILPNSELEYDERYKFITPRMLLNHTSGIENWIEFNDPAILEIVSDPGTEFVYSGAGYNYLADAIAIILGESYEEYMSRLVLKPLNIESKTTYFLDKTRPEIIYSKGHDLKGKVTRSASDHISPASSIFTDAASYAKLLTGLVDERFLTKESIEYIIQQRILFASYWDFKAYLTNGLFVFENGNEIIANFSGSNSGFKSQFAYSVQNKNGFVYLTNSDYGDLMGRRLNRLISDFKFYDIVYFADTYSLEFLSFFRSLYKMKGEENLYYELIGSFNGFDWDQKKEDKNVIFIIFEGIILSIFLIILVLSTAINLLRRRVNENWDKKMKIFIFSLKITGFIYIFIWFSHIVHNIGSLSEITNYTSLLLFLSLLTILIQLFCSEYVKKSFGISFFLVLTIILSLIICTGIPLVFIEKAMISYEEKDLLFLMSKTYFSVILIVFLFSSVFLFFHKTKRI